MPLMSSGWWDSHEERRCWDTDNNKGRGKKKRLRGKILIEQWRREREYKSRSFEVMSLAKTCLPGVTRNSKARGKRKVKNPDELNNRSFFSHICICLDFFCQMTASRATGALNYSCKTLNNFNLWCLSTARSSRSASSPLFFFFSFFFLPIPDFLAACGSVWFSQASSGDLK